jgi:hypothetical protein
MRLRDGAHAEVQPHRLRQQVANLELREVVVRAQHADERQRPRADLSAGHARRQGSAVHSPAGLAHTAVQPVFVDPGAHQGDVEDLMAHRLAAGSHRTAAFAHRRGRAVVDGIDLGLGQQGPEAAGMPFLGATLACAGATLRTVASTRTIGGRRLR